MATATLTKTDQEIQQDVMNELKWDARLQPNEVGATPLADKDKGER